jgi:hypothetical protein
MGIKHSRPSSDPGLIDGDDWDDDHILDGQVNIPVVLSPVTPPAGNFGLFGRSVAGRVLPAVIGPSGLETSLQPILARNKIAWINPNGNSTAVGLLGLAVSITGVATAVNVGTANVHESMRRIEYAVTTAATTAVGSWRSATAQFRVGGPSDPFGGFFFVCRFGRGRGVAANATLRGFTGFGSQTVAPGDDNPSTALSNIIGVGCDAGDTNYQIMHRSGTALATKIDTGFPKAVADNTEMYELAMFTAPAASSVTVQFTRLSDGATFIHTVSTNMPGALTLLAPRGYYSVGGTSSVIGYALASLYIETDY